jgi:predicted permease
MNIFIAILPIFLVIGLGFILAKLGLIKSHWNSYLNDFVYYVALPALIIQSFVSLKIDNIAPLWAVVHASLVIVFFGIICAFLVHLLPFSKKTRDTIFLTAIFGNTIFLGIPLAEKLITSIPSGVITAVAVLQFTSALIVALIFLELRAKDRQSGRIVSNLVHNPLIISLLIGIIFIFIPKTDWLKNIINTPLQMLAQTASPLALFVLGSFLSKHHVKSKLYSGIFIATTLKLLVLPLLFLIAGQFIHLDTDYANLNIILATTPTAVTAFVLAQTYRLDSELATGTMLVTTIVSIISIPLITNSISSIQGILSMIK